MIQNQIQAITDALKWIKVHKPDQYDKQFSVLVEERLKLRKLLAATKENPAIAAYGESQKGKSHVMNNLLLKNGEPYKVDTPEGPIDFISRINPVTHGTEATGVVTRFTAFEEPDGKLNSRYRADHPVLVKLLNPMDMAIILCDSYYFDTDGHEPHCSFKEIETFSQQLLARYQDNAEQPITPIIEDDIFDMKNYVRDHIGTQANNFLDSNYFYNLARVIRQIPYEEYASVFKILWANNEDLTRVYGELVMTHAALGFSSEVYCNIDAVDNNKNTIMAVVCLAGLSPDKFAELDSDDKRYVTAWYQDSHATEHKADRIKKSHMAALCSEVVFKIDAKNLETDIQYNLSSIPTDSCSYISQQGIRKDILHTNDLLDFPGARPRETYPFNDLKVDIMVKRGKVAYLFHKYSEGHIFNILLFCQNNQNMSVTEMYELIGRWVQTYVGRTPEERARMINRTKVPPIFVIGTMFNVVMKESADSSSNSSEKLEERWKEFFDKILNREALKFDTPIGENNDKWFLNWTTDGKPFDNSFVLRDFKYSSDKAGGNLYRGYDPEISGSKEQSMMMNREYYDRMRQTFIDSIYVKRFFSNPALAWDVAASMGNDGIQYIIEKLTVVARNITVARQEQLAEKAAAVTRKVLEILKNYYVNEDSEELLKANIKKAKKVTRELDFTVQQDNYYFGHLIEHFQITERETYNSIHHLITSGELIQTGNDYHAYEILLARCGKSLELCHNDAERWEVIIDEYGLDDKQEAEEYLQRRGIDAMLLFGGTFKKKVNSVTIADRIYELWEGKINSHKIVEEMTSDDTFDAIVMSHLTENIVETAKQVNLADRIADLIKDYVNVMNPDTINKSLVADLMATEINNFIKDFGYHYREDKEKDELKKLADEKHLNCFESICQERKETFSMEELAHMFDQLNENEQTVTPSFRISYDQWVEYMKLSFIGKNAASDYDRAANHAMGEIIALVKTE